MTTPPWADWFPMQTCAGCGDEHPGAECKAQDDLFGVSVGDVVPSHDTLGAQLKRPRQRVNAVTRSLSPRKGPHMIVPENQPRTWAI